MLDRLTAGDTGGPVTSNDRRSDPRPLNQPTPGGRSPTDRFRAPGRKGGTDPSLRDHTFKTPRPYPGDSGPGGGDGPTGGGDETDHSGGHQGSGHGGGGHHGNGHDGHHRNHFYDHRRHRHHYGLRFCFCYGHYCSYYGRYSRFYRSFYYNPARYWYRYCYVPYYYPAYSGIYGSYSDDYGALADPSYSAYDLLGYGGAWGTFASGGYPGGGGGGGGGGGVYSAELLLPSRDQAWSLMAEGQIEVAQQMFGSIVAQMPYEGEARIGFAITTALLGDGERAVALMRRALADDPESLYDVPLDDVVREKIELLLEAYSALVRADLANTDSLLMAASLRFILGDYPGAFFAIDAGIKAGDDDESAANLHAMLRAIMFESF